MVNAQQWLDKNYPKEIRNKIKNLYLKEKELEGNLDLSDFVNLERLDCSTNKLSGLGLNQGKNLIYLDCRSNELVDLDLASLNPEKITRICLNNNNIALKNLNCFQNFVNLERLEIANYDEKKIQKGLYNHFVGSLRPMNKLSNLKWLNISNTDINSGVEYLPNNIERIYYSTKERPESKLKEIVEQLNLFLSKRTKRDWKVIHPSFTEWKQREWENLRFNYQDTEKWLRVGLRPNDYHFAAWLRWKGYKPEQNLNWEELRSEDKSVQKLLDNEYTPEVKKWVTWLDINRSGLEGNLIVSDFPRLERLDCSVNQLNSVELSNLPKLIRFDGYENKLTNLIINNCPEINRLDIRENSLTNLNFLNNLNPEKLIHFLVSNNNLPELNVSIFSKFKNLKDLWLTGNRFYGDLKSLRNLSKLDYLTVSDTNINSGFEYLSNSLRGIASVESQELTESTSNFELIGQAELVRKKGSESDYYPVPYYDFKHWKENQPYFKWLEEELKKVNPNFNINDVLGNIFFNVRTGDFEGNLQSIVSLLQINKAFIEEKEREINILEARIQELDHLIKQQKEKIVDSFLCLAPEREKELLQELIRSYLEFKKVEGQELPSLDYEDQYLEIKNKVRKKLGKELTEKMQIILKDCGKLTSWELELEEKFNAKLLLLEEQKQVTRLTISTNLDSLKKRLKSHMEQKQLSKFIEGRVKIKIRWIEKIEVFPTWFNDVCALVVGQEKNQLGQSAYNLWIVTYEPSFGKIEERTNYLKIAKFPSIKERWEEVIEYFKKALNSDYPATEVLNSIYTFKLPSLVQDYGNIEKRKFKISSQTNPDDYIRPYDIIKRKIDSLGFFYHYAIYLGKNKVVHISKGEEKSSLDDFRARVDTWEHFLKGREEIEINHPFIPFKRPELIKDHIDIAVKAKYGWGKYHLLKDNCEHFAKMCVYGLGISQQKNLNTTNKAIKGADYLLKAIQKSNEFFKRLKKISVSEEETMELDEKQFQENWATNNPPFLEFTEFITQERIEHGFKNRLDIGLQAQVHGYVEWLRDKIKLTPEQILNHYQEQELKKEYQFYLTTNSKEQPQKLKEISPQLTTINKQINEIEKEIKDFRASLKDELSELVDKFVEANKKIIKEDNEDKETRKEIKKLHKTLREKGFLKKDIEKVIRYCERLVDLEWQKEQEELQTNIEIPPKGY